LFSFLHTLEGAAGLPGRDGTKGDKGEPAIVDLRDMPHG